MLLVLDNAAQHGQSSLRSRKTNLGFGYNYKAVSEFVGVFSEQPADNVDLIGGPFVVEAKEDDSVVLTAFAKDHFSEILVVSYQYPVS